MEEIWKDIPGYEGLYEVSNLGRVRSLNYKNGGRGQGVVRMMTPSVVKRGGYLRVTLTKDGIKKYLKVHRLVGCAFLPNPDNRPQIDHINTIRTDNRVENLRWTTQQENLNNELSRKHISESLTGKKRGARPESVINKLKSVTHTWSPNKGKHWKIVDGKRFYFN